MGDLAEAGVSMKASCDELLADGVTIFSDAFDQLLARIEMMRQAQLGSALAGQQVSPAQAQKPLSEALETWRREGRVRRLWKGDSSLWTGA